MDQKTVFISYRRSTSKHLARSIYQNLKMNDWDAFFDVNSIDSGDFDRIILSQIGARAHFILLISPGSLERCANSGDWVLREIEEALRLERNFVPIIEEATDFDREVAYLPASIRAEVSKKNGIRLLHDYFDEGLERLRTRFLKAPAYIQIVETPPAERAEVQRRMASIESSPDARSSARSQVADLLPAPFAWITIPGSSYSIAQYPITNAQFAPFVQAGGYHSRKWWTNAGWEMREKNQWTEPRYWRDTSWNDASRPVVGVSWVEAAAFCRWLSETSGEGIHLPTLEQWRYAAQGSDNRRYPWGQNWDANRCNHNVNDRGSGRTTAVSKYAGKNKGDSPFGVSDMTGNVREWCRTDPETGSNDPESSSTYRAACGGSWMQTQPDQFQVDRVQQLRPQVWDNTTGFRIVLE